jgi:quercetin dioxygenase-like cupin family protein
MTVGRIVSAGGGRQFRTPFGTVGTVKIDVDEGDFAMFESGPPPGHGQPPHVHDKYDEAFYLLAGDVVFSLGGSEITATVGDSVFAPRGTVHGFRNRGLEPARMLVIATPRAVELVESLGRLAEPGLPPDPVKLQELFGAHYSRLVLGADEGV